MPIQTTIIQESEVINGGILKATPLNARFDAMLIQSHIADAERRHFLPCFCREFYARLIAEKNPTPSNYNPDLGPIVQAYPNDAVLELFWTEILLKFLSCAGLYEALPFIGMQIGSNGIFINDSHNAQPAGVNGIKFLQDTLLERLQRQKELFEKEICENDQFDDLVNYDLCENYCKDCSGDDDDITKTLGIIIY